MRVGDKAFVSELLKALDRRAEDREKKRLAKTGIGVVSAGPDSDRNYSVYLYGTSSGYPASGGFKSMNGIIPSVGDTVSYTIDGQQRHITGILYGNTSPYVETNPTEGWTKYTDDTTPSSPPPAGEVYYYYKNGTPYYMLSNGLEYPVEPGTTWHNGSGAPSGALGSVGDYYIDTDTGDLYEKTGASTWTLRVEPFPSTGTPPTTPTNLALIPASVGFMNRLNDSNPIVNLDFSVPDGSDLPDLSGSIPDVTIDATHTGITFEQPSLIAGDQGAMSISYTDGHRHRYDMDGLSQSLTSKLTAGTGFTYSMLCSLDVLPDNGSATLNQIRQDDNGWVMAFDLLSNKLRFIVGDDGGTQLAIQTTANVQTGKTLLVVGTYDPTDDKTRLYVNGNLEATSATFTGNAPDWETPLGWFYVGLWTAATNNPTMTVGMTAIHDYTMSQSEVTAWYDSLQDIPQTANSVGLTATWDDSTTEIQRYTLQHDRAYTGTVGYTVAASGTGGSLAAGDYTVAVTGVANNGESAAASTTWKTATVAAGQRLYVNITDLPVTVASYNIYCGLDGTDTSPLYHANTTTTGSDVEVTARGTGAAPPAESTLATFDNPVTAYTDVKTHTITGLLGGTYYAARVKVTDKWNQSTAFTSAVIAKTGADSSAPDIPVGLTLSQGYRSVGARWEPEGSRDFAYYEVRYTPEDGTTPNTPDEGEWQTIRTASNWIIVSDLYAGVPGEPNTQTTYFFQVRTVDTSGNASDWSNQAGDYVSENPSLITTADIAYNSILAGHISAGGIEAEKITSGTLKIGGSTNSPDYLLVYDATGQEIGRWDATGLTIADPGEPNKVIQIIDGVLRFSTDTGATWGTAIDATGIVADSIKSGSIPGGHNPVPNSSFELAPFATINVTTWTSAADWQGHLASSNVNWDDTSDPADMLDYTY